MKGYGELNADHIIYNEFFQQLPKGIIVEVGAGDPTYISMSKAYKEIGWRTICIDPNPHWVDLHKEAGNEIYQYALSSELKDKAKFFIYKKSPMSYSSLGIRYLDYKLHEEKFDQIDVEVKTLTWLLEDLKIEKIDLLTIDTEGWELDVLRGFDAAKYDPKIIMIECPMPASVEEQTEYMKGIGYVLWKRLAINYIYKKNIEE